MLPVFGLQRRGRRTRFCPTGCRHTGTFQVSTRTRPPQTHHCHARAIRVRTPSGCLATCARARRAQPLFACVDRRVACSVQADELRARRGPELTAQGPSNTPRARTAGRERPRQNTPELPYFANIRERVLVCGRCRQSHGPGELAIHAILARHFAVDGRDKLGRVRRQARGLVLVLVIIVASRRRARHLCAARSVRCPWRAGACAWQHATQPRRARLAARARARRRSTWQHARRSCTAQHPLQGAGGPLRSAAVRHRPLAGREARAGCRRRAATHGSGRSPAGKARHTTPNGDPGRCRRCAAAAWTRP